MQLRDAFALLSAGFRSELFPLKGPRDLRPLLEAARPPLIIAVSLSFQWRAMDFLELAASLREGGYAGHLTGGGHFGTFCCQESLGDFPELDSICRQEAEETLVELARAVKNGEPFHRIPGVATRRPRREVFQAPLRPPPEIDRLPWPDRRGIRQPQNHKAMLLLEELAVFVCFNLMIFDPDTTVESLEENFRFMETFGHVPFNFGRVELYAGTPLLRRMQKERRCRGDYMAWDYSLGNPTMERVFKLAIR